MLYYNVRLGLNKMTKKSLLALLLIAVMLLSGCSLVVKDDAVDALQTIIDVNGEIVNKNTFQSAYEYNLYMEQYYAQLSAMYLGNQEEVDEAAVREETLTSYVTTLVKNQKSAELGFDQFTDEELAKLDEQAKADYDEQLETIKQYYFADSELDAEALAKEVEAYAANMGYTPETMLAAAKNSLTNEKLEASVKDLVTIDDSELQIALDAKIAADKADLESNAGAYGTKANAGSAVYYTPAGYRTVRVIEVAKPAETPAAEQTATGEIVSAEQTVTGETLTAEQTVTGETLTAEPDEARAEIDALKARLDAGEAFDAVSAEQKQYAVCESSTDVDAAIVSAVMALTEKGSYTDVIETTAGYAIALYEDDIAEHTATLDEARDGIYDETLTGKKTAAYDAAVAQWESEADVKIYRNRLN